MSTKLLPMRVHPEPPALLESSVDRAVRLHVAYVALRRESRDAVAGLTDAEWREYIERVGR